MSRSKWKLIGQFDVDSGLCWIGDPCYILPDDSATYHKKGLDYKDLLFELEQEGSPVAKEFKHVTKRKGRGLCVNTGGDGTFCVWATFRDGLIQEIKIVLRRKIMELPKED